ncbi:putative NXPE family member 3 [Apostichopus japonicus]|uniref:Putative NXPE family member 3 n=1 Tax=Stichopus japonicus TaxID=307972 RepID=A0A2G8JFU1_STIJA|nr:putative NXPE family member 3 [Apostichopus japonicus]
MVLTKASGCNCTMKTFYAMLLIMFGTSLVIVFNSKFNDLTKNQTPDFQIQPMRYDRRTIPQMATKHLSYRRNGDQHARTCPKRPTTNIYKTYVTGGDKTMNNTILSELDFVETTSPNFTTFSIIDEKKSYKLCELLVVKIESRDWKNNSKTYGGDFFRLKIFSEDKAYSAAGEDELIDFQNGTYLAFFTLRWSGKVKVQVKLIHPVEVLPQMRLTLTGRTGMNSTFVGIFVNKNISEEVFCRYVVLEPPFCNLSDPLTHGPWFCKKPTDSRLTCDDWKWHKKNRNGTFLKLEENLTPLSKELLTKSHMVNIPGNRHSIIVEEKYGDLLEQEAAMTLPYCSMKGVPNGIHNTGHFFKDVWYPHECTVKHFTVETGMKCLANQNLVLLGDSTIRQVFEYFRDVYKKYLKELPLPEGAYSGYGPLRLQNEKSNTFIEFHFHGLPSSGSKLLLRTDYIEFIANRLNSGRDGCEVVYVLSVWAHFIAAGKEFYLQRLLAIKEAVKALLDRCPTAKVIIKGANTKDHPALWIAIISSEWNIAAHEADLRELFQDEKRVGFIDALEITKVQKYKDFVHPNRKIVGELVNRLLTYLCYGNSY